MKHRLRAALMTAAYLLSAPTAHADNDLDTFLMNTAIIATTLSWAGAVAVSGGSALTAPFTPGGTLHGGMAVGQASQINMTAIQIGPAFGRPLLAGHWGQLHGHWEIDLTLWQADHAGRRNPSGWMLGLTPVLQYQWSLPVRPYLELGVGLRLLSDIRMADQYKSTRLQFGDLIGIGMTLGRWQVGLRYLHVSNANIEVPNPGTNFYTLKLDYRF